MIKIKKGKGERRRKIELEDINCFYPDLTLPLSILKRQ
jgi:hypothetical protein